MPTYSPWTPAQTITFSSSGGYKFTCLAGDGAPTITDGFAQIDVVARPRRKAYTQLAGYNPMVLTVPLRFDATITPANPIRDAVALERDIQYLEGMAGRGKYVSTDQTIQAGAGNPPTVKVFGIHASHSTNLIPKNVHGITWVISGIDYDENPTRNATGNRRRQDVTVTLTEWVAPAIVKTANKSGPVYTVYKTDTALNTVAKIVRAHTAARSTSQFRRALSFSRAHGATYKSYNQHLKIGTKVYIPFDLL